ncbi:MAG: TonB-dependent receptor [Pseudomonadota bacterium]
MFSFKRKTAECSQWLLAAVCVASATTAFGQSEGARQFEFDIPGQPLSEALVDFSEVTRYTVAANSADIRSLDSSPVRGTMTAKAALDGILASTGLSVVTVNGSSFALQGSAVMPATGSSSQPEVRDEIVVTGTKRNLSLQDTQASVALVTSEQIEEQALFNVEDILLRTANVSTDASGALNNLSIRGVTLTGIGFAGTGAAANVYVDGSPNSFNANQGAANLWDVAQVEILRGPQSTVQGRNALAGAVIINTADPEYDFGADFRVLAGNEDNRQYSAMFTGPLIEDKLAFRVAVDQRELDFGVVNLDTGNNTRFRDELTARAKLLWEPTDAARLEFIVSYVDTEFGEFNNANAPVPATDPAFDDFDPFGDVTFGPRERFEFNEVIRYTLDTTWDLSEHWTLYAIGTFEDSQRDSDFGDLGSGDAPDETYSAELRAAFDYGRLSGWIGAYYFDTTGSFGGVFNFSPAIFGIPTVPADGFIIFDTKQEDATENAAIFADITYEINDSWSVSFGARFDDETFSDTGTAGEATAGPGGCTVDPNVPMLGGFPCTVLFPPSAEDVPDADFDAFLPRGTVIHRFDENRSISLTVAQGYRAGGSYLFAAPGDVPETRTFDPEFLTNYEFAFRSEWPNQDIVLNANVFFSDWEDQQVTIPGPSGAIFDQDTLNIGSSELYGIEVEFRHTPTDNFDWFATLGYMQTEFTNFPFAIDGMGNPSNPTNPIFANLRGNEFNSAPNLNLAAGFSYRHPTGVFVNSNVSYADEQFSDVTNLPQNEVGDYVLVNARVGYERDNWRVSVFADNLFDERFVGRQGVFSVSTATGTIDPNTQPFFTVNDPRIFGVELRVSY